MNIVVESTRNIRRVGIGMHVLLALGVDQPVVVSNRCQRIIFVPTKPTQNLCMLKMALHWVG